MTRFERLSDRACFKGARQRQRTAVGARPRGTPRRSAKSESMRTRTVGGLAHGRSGFQRKCRYVLTSYSRAPCLGGKSPRPTSCEWLISRLPRFVMSGSRLCLCLNAERGLPIPSLALGGSPRPEDVDSGPDTSGACTQPSSHQIAIILEREFGDAELRPSTKIRELFSEP